MKKVGEDVIAKLKRGSELAFEELFNAYKDVVFYLTYSYLQNQKDADDCLQEVFLRLLDNIHLYDRRKSSFEAWFMTLARNHTLNYVRHKKVDSNKVVDNENDVEKTAIQPAHEKSLMLEDLKKLLGEVDYTIVIYRSGYNMSFRTIAELCDLSKETIRKRFKIAFKCAKNYLK